MIAGGGTEGVEITPPTQEELQQVCIHVWRDIENTGTTIRQECIRCKKERTLSII